MSSLFASLGGNGDIWALSGISFVSPVNDILEKGTFTLEDFLEEDELIQEVKQKHDRLLQFLSTGETVGLLLDYILTPPDLNAALHEKEDDKKKRDLRTYKYPYMSCEVICCEVPEILNILVDEYDGIYLNKLFSFLQTETLDCYLAGYFEKILEMLFRKKTTPMMKYFNSGGTDLLRHFLNHIDNYSIMQIVQRLMLPHIPFSNSPEMENLTYEEIKEFFQCNWSYLIDSCRLLFEKMFEPANADIPLHISDLLITVLQLSPPETLVIKFLCEPECVVKLLDCVVTDEADMMEASDSFSSAASISLSAISVLESLISRLFESSLPFEKTLDGNDMDNDQDHIIHTKESIDIICSQISLYLPKLNSILQKYITCNPCSPLTSQGKQTVPRLGHRGLQLVKLIESIVRLGNTGLDLAISEAGILKTCLEIFFVFENNSLLHLSVQRILVTIIEGESLRRDAQICVLIKCDLLNIVMKKLEEYRIVDQIRNSSSHGGDLDVMTASASEKYLDNSSSDSATSVLDDSGKRRQSTLTSKHSSMMGNMILISQSLSISLEDPSLCQTMMDHMDSSSSFPSSSDRLHNRMADMQDEDEDEDDDYLPAHASPPSSSQALAALAAATTSSQSTQSMEDEIPSDKPTHPTAEDAVIGADSGLNLTTTSTHLAAGEPFTSSSTGPAPSSPSSDDDIDRKDVKRHNQDHDHEDHMKVVNAINMALWPEETTCDDDTEFSLRSLLEDDPSHTALLGAWDGFVNSKLRDILDHQIVGSYQPNASPAASLVSGGDTDLDFDGSKRSISQQFAELGFHDNEEEEKDEDDDYTEEHNLFANFSNHSATTGVEDGTSGDVFSGADIDFADFDAFGEEAGPFGDEDHILAKDAEGLDDFSGVNDDKDDNEYDDAEEMFKDGDKSAAAAIGEGEDSHENDQKDFF